MGYFNEFLFGGPRPLRRPTEARVEAEAQRRLAILKQERAAATVEARRLGREKAKQRRERAKQAEAEAAAKRKK